MLRRGEYGATEGRCGDSWPRPGLCNDPELKRRRTIHVSLRETPCGSVCKPVQAESEIAYAKGASQGATRLLRFAYGRVTPLPLLRLKGVRFAASRPGPLSRPLSESMYGCGWGSLAGAGGVSNGAHLVDVFVCHIGGHVWNLIGGHVGHTLNRREVIVNEL